MELFFSDQAEALKKAGFKIWLDDPLKWNEGTTPNDFTAVRRGWRVKQDEYAAAMSRIEAIGVKPFTDLTSYLATHYHTRWYETLKDLTFETRFFKFDENLEKNVEELGWEWFIVKDWVKTIQRTIGGAAIVNLKTLKKRLPDLEKAREYIEGGITIRKWEPIDSQYEQRFFVINGESYSNDGGDCPEIVKEVARRIKLSGFYAVDVANRIDGEPRVVELNDGQVSDLGGAGTTIYKLWSPERFAEIWSEHK